MIFVVPLSEYTITMATNHRLTINLVPLSGTILSNCGPNAPYLLAFIVGGMLNELSCPPV